MSAAEFFDADVGALTAIVNGGAAEVTGLFDLDAAQLLGVDTEGPSFTCEVTAGLVGGDRLTILGDDYEITDRLTADSDVVVWRLHRA